MTAAAEMPEDLIDAAAKICRGLGIASTPTNCYPIIEGLKADRQRDQWQDISTAPKDGTAIDLWGVNHLHYAKTGRRATNVTWGPVRDWMGNEREDWQHGHGEDFEPTHWMPLPSAPKGGA